MSQSFRMGAILLVWATFPGLVGAQEPEVGLAVEDAVEFHRDLARARFEVSQADVKTLELRRIQAAEALAKERWEEWLIGRIALDKVLHAQARLAQARQRSMDVRSLSRPALEALWRAQWNAHTFEKSKFEAGLTSHGNYYESLDSLLDTEIQLALTRKK